MLGSSFEGSLPNEGCVGGRLAAIWGKETDGGELTAVEEVRLGSSCGTERTFCSGLRSSIPDESFT